MRWRCATHRGWRWFACNHAELAHPWLGRAIMAVGALTIGLGLGELWVGYS